MAPVRNGAAYGSIIAIGLSVTRWAAADTAAFDVAPAPRTSATAPETEQAPPPQTTPPTVAPPPPQTPPTTTTPTPAPPAAMGYAQPAPPTGYGYDPSRYWRPPPRRVRTWYGWQTLIVDGLSITLLVAGSGGSGSLAGFGGLGYLFGAPIVHWGHGNVGKGFGSLGMRVGGTAVAFFGLLSCLDGFLDEGGGNGSEGGCYLALLGGAIMVAAIPIDAAALAYDEPEESTGWRRSLHDLAIVPVFGPTRGSGAFGARSASGDIEARPWKQTGIKGGFLLSARF